MSNSRAEAYRGPLSPIDLAQGLTAAKANARRLLDDAATLYELGRFPSAMSLAVLSIEELGKLPILRRMALAESGDDWRSCWRDFASHTTKSAHWIVPFLVREAKTPESFYNFFAARRDPVLLDSLKQLGLYVGCYGRAHWSEPHKVIRKEQVAPIMYAARALAAGSAPSPLDSPAAVELWSKEMRGCFRCGSMVAGGRVVTFLEGARAQQIHLEGEGIPPGVAFEFMSTVLYISEDEPTSIQ